MERTNTILYCARWPETVNFYRRTLGLRTSFENDWFVEFDLGRGAFVSIADAARASISAGGGAGLTLSWQVSDVRTIRDSLVERGVAASPVSARWGAETTFVCDPEGNRIELWSPE